MGLGRMHYGQYVRRVEQALYKHLNGYIDLQNHLFTRGLIFQFGKELNLRFKCIGSLLLS